jgi:hypothetical protein
LLPGVASSRRITTDKAVPITPEIAPKMKYKMAMFLWLVEHNQRLHQSITPFNALPEGT